MHVVVAVCLVQYTENRKSTHIVVVAAVVYQLESAVVADVVGVVCEVVVVVVVYCTLVV